MIQIKVKTRGLLEFIEANKKVIAALERGDFTLEFAKTCENRAKYRAPRKTGKLIKGIRYKIDSAYSFTLSCSAVNKQGVEYPEILEFGLSRYIPIGEPNSPRVITSGGGKAAYLPFMRWAIWRTTQEAEIIFKKKILKYYK